jgi:hypothetical protein
MHEKSFNPGFRFSAADGVAIGLAIIGASVARGPVSLLIAYVLGHFFLFCNVFRVARPLELAWAAVFIGLAAATITAGVPAWGVTIAVSLATTVVVIFFEMRKPSYHGVAWQRINPRLVKWFERERVQRIDDERRLRS